MDLASSFGRSSALATRASIQDANIRALPAPDFRK